MNRKIIFFDIDGTLIAEGTHYLPPSTVAAIQKARANGHLAFINTGRTHFNLEPEIRDIGFDGSVCGCGTYIYIGETPVFSSTLSHETCVEIIEMLRKYNICALFEENDKVFFDGIAPTNDKLRELKALLGIYAYDVNESLSNPDMHFDKFVTWLNGQSNFQPFYQYITKEFDYIDRGDNFAEIVPKGYSKATGIQFLLDYYHIPLESCYAIGDSTNDLPMLEYVPNSIAMGNAMKDILPCCAYQTADILDDGIEKALKHYKII